MIQPPCKSCLLHAAVTSLGPGKQDYIQLDSHWMCHMGIQPEETVWVLAERPQCMWTAFVIPGAEGMGQLAVYGSQADRLTIRTRLTVYGMHADTAAALSQMDWETWEPSVVVQLSEGNRIDVVRISTGIDAQENPVRGEWACEQSI